LFDDWNRTEADYPRDRCLHQLFEAQVERTPEAIAVEYGGQKLSYRELDARANQFARFLNDSGVVSGALVGVFMERSLEMVVALCGILKAGAAYLPLDPEYPGERIAFILGDAQVELLVTEQGLEDQLPDNSSQLIFMDKDWPQIEAHSTSVPDTAVTPDSIAYVIYTSGSTGKPKGVQVPHRTVSNFLTSMAREPGISPDDVLLAVTTISFDIAVLELFLPLVSGARIELADRITSSDGTALLDKIKTSGVTIMQATPSTWRLMLSAGWGKLDNFKVLCGGEAMPADLAVELVNHASSVWNMYGPTETTVWSTVYQIEDGHQPVLIGKPISNTQVYILDESMQQQPVGVAGELYIGGSGVTCGYLNREELTKERFVKDIFGKDESGHLYRTGDLVRYRDDGNIEYINRLDNQVKVRGFRIELGEIEAVLSSHPDVDQCVVVVREDRPGDKRLVAYYVQQAGDEVSGTVLRKHLRSTLPNYMVPQYFVDLDALPVTPNGKVDRKALPVPFNTGPVEEGYVAPRTENETILANIWQEVLGIDKVGVYDNFFELGGHSLLSLKVISRVRDEAGVELKLILMVTDTLEQIAAQCQTMAASDEASKAPVDTNFVGRLFRKLGAGVILKQKKSNRG
jgi:amino acid adenylation domain-containing protein